jgi:hypothetical protein
MEPAAFDGLTRQIGDGSAARRTLLRALGVALLGGAVAPPRLAAVAANKKHGTRRPARQGHVRDERKHRRKKRRKKFNKTPAPQWCGDDARRCTEGMCVSQGACCPDERTCDDGTCVSPEECCPTMKRCDDGRCVSPCSGGKELDPEICQCECPSGSVLMADGSSCCPNENICGLNEAGLVTTCCWYGGECTEPNYCS